MISNIIELLRNRKQGLSLYRIYRELRLSPEEKSGLQKTLEKLENQGILLRFKRRYIISGRSGIKRGRLSLSEKGYGFVKPEGRDEEEIFIPPRFIGEAIGGDEVEVLVKERGRRGKAEGKIIRIIRKSREKLIGLYRERFGKPYFVPLDLPLKEIPLKRNPELSPLPGTIVEVERESFRLQKIIGMPDEPGVDSRVIIQRYELPFAFSKEALEEAERISPAIPQEEIKDRVDFRHWLTITIDGENAQDFDDAVSLRRLSNGNFLLGVHIADVSHYVHPGTHLDREAYLRGTSVYFPDLTVPMLPERLSNFICSLRPGEDRLAFSLLLEIDRAGSVVGKRLLRSIIRTSERMTYTAVFRILEGDEELRQRFRALVPVLLRMRELARILKRNRERQGSLDFDLVEPELVYREGSLISVLPSERNEAHQIIEEFMLVANEAVSSFLEERGIPFLYRIHPPPGVQDLERLRELLAPLGINLPSASKVTQRELQHVLKMAKGNPAEKFINFQVLRSLKLAMYSDENKGHYGLSKKTYTHFTSPIRRYPDLVVHRILKGVLSGDGFEVNSLSSLAEHCSWRERNAEHAERELIEWRIFRFLKEKVGERVEGTVVDVSREGILVEIDNYLVEGIIPQSELCRRYFSPRKSHSKKRRKERFERGERVKVILASVDPVLRRIYLALSASERGEEN